MSNLTNIELEERVYELLDLATEHAEFWTGTQWAKTIDLQRAQLIKLIEANDWEGVYNTMWVLERTVAESAREIDKWEKQ